MNPGDIVPLTFSYGLVALSYVIAVAGAYVALVCAARIRSIDAGPMRTGYIVLAAVALGGVGIWSMHFIGMQAQTFPFGLVFGVFPTLSGLLIAIICSGVAFWYVARAPFSTINCIVGGTIAGIGVAAMHYMGVFAMKIPARIDWNVGLVMFSILVAIAAASAALWLAFNIESVRQRVMAAFLMGAAVCGMHYTGTAAGTVICTTPLAVVPEGLGGMSLPYMTFFLSAGLLLALRLQLRRTSIQYRAVLAARMDTLIDPTERPVA